MSTIAVVYRSIQSRIETKSVIKMISQPLSAPEFYNKLAVDYDEMTQFDQRLKAERPSLENLINRYQLKKVLDVGCGTGVHSIILARSGVEVIATDQNLEMITRARENARKEAVQVRFIQSRFLDLEKNISGTFDGIICFGNSLPHILSEKELEETIRIFHQFLLPGGMLMIQNLNYDDLLNKKQRILNTKENNGILITRFYDYHQDMVTFNILRSWKEEGVWRSNLISTELKPWTRIVLRDYLQRAGFTEIGEHANLNLGKYEESSSPNLVLIAKK